MLMGLEQVNACLFFYQPNKTGNYLHTRRAIPRIQCGDNLYHEESISIVRAGVDGEPSPPIHHRFFRISHRGKEEIITLTGYGENRMGRERETVDFEMFKSKILTARSTPSALPIDEKMLDSLIEKVTETGLDKYPLSSGFVHETEISHYLKKTEKGTVWIIPSYESMQPTLSVYINEDDIREMRSYRIEGPFLLPKDSLAFKKCLTTLEKTHSIQAVHWGRAKIYPCEKEYKKETVALKHMILNRVTRLSPKEQSNFITESFLVNEEILLNDQTVICAGTNLLPLPLSYSKTIQHRLAGRSRRYFIGKEECPEIIFPSIQTPYNNIHREPLSQPHMLLGIAAQKAHHLSHLRKEVSFPLEEKLGSHFLYFKSTQEVELHLKKENIPITLGVDPEGRYFFSRESEVTPSYYVKHTRVAFNPYDEEGNEWIFEEDKIGKRRITERFPVGTPKLLSSEEKKIIQRFCAFQKTLLSPDTIITRDPSPTKESSPSPMKEWLEDWYKAPPASRVNSSETLAEKSEDIFPTSSNTVIPSDFFSAQKEKQHSPIETGSPEPNYRQQLFELLDTFDKEKKGSGRKASESTTQEVASSSRRMLTLYENLTIQPDPQPENATEKENKNKETTKQSCCRCL